MLSQITNPINTGLRRFDRQAKSDCITSGNVWGSVQFSSFVRGRNVLECNGFKYAPGDLQKFDLANFPRLPIAVLNATKRVSDEHGQAILYEYRHWEDKHKVVHGYIITEGSHDLVHAFSTSKRNSRNLIKKMIPYITNSMEVADDFEPTVLP